MPTLLDFTKVKHSNLSKVKTRALTLYQAIRGLHDLWN
ncbi:MAG: hypothetical protein CMIDDMOC_00085 [Sodalis sp. Fle]|nr:MAG: hypothetical protein CMIDDMOC_00085 [Sodalis sp. Fle]